MSDFFFFENKKGPPNKSHIYVTLVAINYKTVRIIFTLNLRIKIKLIKMNSDYISPS